MALRLTYFDISGRAEVSRLLLTLGGVEFEDVRVSREEWGKLKAEGVSPYGQLPFLEVDGKILGQSAAIGRYCAKRAGLTPEDDFEAGQVDAIIDTQEDVLRSIMPTFALATTEEKIAARQELLAPEGKGGKVLGLIEAQLRKNNDGAGWIVGDKITFADINI